MEQGGLPLQGKQFIFFLQQIDVLFLVLELVFHLQFGDLQGLGSVVNGHLF